MRDTLSPAARPRARGSSSPRRSSGSSPSTWRADAITAEQSGPCSCYRSGRTRCCARRRRPDASGCGVDADTERLRRERRRRDRPRSQRVQGCTAAGRVPRPRAASGLGVEPLCGRCSSPASGSCSCCRSRSRSRSRPSSPAAVRSSTRARASAGTWSRSSIFKFRTLLVDAEQRIGARLLTPGDPLYTPIGRFLKRTKLDEIPQLLNVDPRRHEPGRPAPDPSGLPRDLDARDPQLRGALRGAARA